MIGKLKQFSKAYENHAHLSPTLLTIIYKVTPFGLLNDRECLVKYFLENKAYDSCDYLGFHPNSCISTVAIHKEDFISILEDPSMGNHTVTRIDM